ncbi:MAG: DUF1800 family protein, partial [Planctomycetes bacterium]|nr:DUF1800 family protein [Planctomycetota bacterium]
KAGGDISPFDVAGARVQAPDIGGAVKQFDVTAALQAWSSGAPNFGWVVRSSAPNDVTLIHSDDAALATDRPKLVVTWRPPVAGPPSGTVAPTAHAGPDQDVFSNTRVQLDANGSYHLQGLNFDVAWAQISGPHAPLIPAPNTPAGTFVGITLRPQFIAPIVTAPTDLEFLLVAIRGGDFTIDTVTVRVSPQPGGGSTSSPLIDAGPDQTVVELSTTTLAAQISGGIGPFESVWTKISGPAITLASPDALSTTFVSPPVSSAGADLLFEIELIDLGAPFSSVVRDTVAVHINNIQNQAPIARAGVDLDVDVGDWVVLDASASSDADGHPLVFTWSQSSGPGVPLTQYRSAGTAEAARTPFKAPIVTVTTTLTFSVLVSDNELSHTDQITVTVRPNINEFSGNPSSLAPYGPTLTKREVRHLLRRVGAGWHPEDVGIVQSASRDPQIGLDGIVTAMMVPMLQDSPEAMAIFDEAMNYAAALASPSAGTPTKNQPFDPYVSPTTTQMMATWTVYTLRSPAPLHERLTRFWHGRLAASVRNLADGRRHWSLLHSDMLRFGVRVDCYTNAPNLPVTQCPLIAGTGPYGNYREILIAWLNDPLTLAFIDGFDNLRFAPNENLGREFMELHSLGILDENGVPIYGENDVKEVARAFTGWRPSCFVVDQSRPASCFPSFVTFFHDYGQKSILGSAPFDFDDVGVVDRVLSYDGGDNAARWLARGLLKYFVTHEPSPALVQALAAEILQNNWELSPTLHTLLSSQAMFAAVHRKALVQSPVDLCNGMIRTLRVSLQSRDIVQADIRANLDILGHRLGDPTDVNGFPEDVEWLDEFAVIRRSELIRKILLRARQPSLPEPQPGSPPGTLPDAPNHLSVAVAIDAFLPPVGARNTENTTRLLMELLDVDLHQTAAVGAAVSEFVLARDYLDLPTSGAFPGPFDGDNPGHDDRLWSLIHLLFEHPEFQRM